MKSLNSIKSTITESSLTNSFLGGYSLGFAFVLSLFASRGMEIPSDSELGLTNRKGGGHYSSAGMGDIGHTVKAFIVGIILYFVAVAIVYTIGSSNIINNTTINTQIKNVAYFMSVLGTIIGLVAGTIFVLKLLGGF